MIALLIVLIVLAVVLAFLVVVLQGTASEACAESNQLRRTVAVQERELRRLVDENTALRLQAHPTGRPLHVVRSEA